MRWDRALVLLAAAIAGPLCGSCNRSSPTAVETPEHLRIRTWSGVEFFLIAMSDTTIHGRDFVETFEFRSDGSYFYYKPSMSSLGRIGQWELNDHADTLTLSAGDTYAEAFAIRSLTATALVLGDTLTRGYSLIPSTASPLFRIGKAHTTPGRSLVQ